MTNRRNCLPMILALMASINASALDKDKKWTPPSIDSVSAKQSAESVTIAARSYEQESEAKAAFGKMHPYKHGVLPVLVLIRNDGKQTIKLDNMKVEYVDGRAHVEATPAKDVPYAVGPERPKFGPSPIPTRGIGRVKKNPLQGEEIEVRAFSAKMLPPGETASGFFYFQTPHKPNSKLYISGLQAAPSGKELFYFELPLD